jgi:hypothetical protein
MQSKYNTADLYSNVVIGAKCENKNEFCIIDEAKVTHAFGLNDFFAHEKVDHTFSCGTDTTKPVVQLSYPGEACNADTDCFKSTSFDPKCTDKKCIGKKAGEECKDSTDCLIGNYCKTSNEASVCAAQVEVGKECKTSYDCVNNAVCNKNVCIAMYSLKIGEKFENTETIFDRHFCELSENFEKTCVKKVYADSTDKFKTCKLGDKCKYNYVWDKNTQDAGSLDCECGYNAEGQGYCPRSQTNCILLLI